jgi:hypothetical protein
MSNQKPVMPDLSCPVPEQETEGYYTSDQSMTNVSRKDRFRLIVNIPKCLRSTLNRPSDACHGGNLEKLSINIWGNVLPEINVPKLDKPMGSQTLKFSSYSRAAYPAIIVNFTIDNKFDNYYVLYKWLDFMSDEEEGSFDAKRASSAYGNTKDYTSTFTLQVLDEYENIVAEFDYLNSFPTTLGNINYSSRDTGEIECSFTFEFNQLKMRLV